MIGRGRLTASHFLNPCYPSILSILAFILSILSILAFILSIL